MKIRLLFYIGLLLFPLSIQAQQEIRENDKGEKIVVYPDGSWRYFNETLRRSPGTYPVSEFEVSGLEKPITLTEDIARRIVVRQAQLAEEATVIAEERAAEASRQRQRIEQEQDFAARGGQKDPESMRRINIRLNAARQTEETARQEAQLARNELARARSLEKQDNVLQEFAKPMQSRAGQLSLNARRDYSMTDFALIDPIAQFTYNLTKEENLLLRPPTEQCSFAFEGKEERSNRIRRDLTKKLLFTYTDERLRMYMKDRDYLRCEGYLSSLAGGYRFLTLEFTFAYPNAREAYGFIEAGSILTINLLNGDFINLKAGTMDQGSYDMEQDLLTYRVKYPIDQSQLSFLKNSELESIKVFWSSGFEEYPVYEMDFFMQQIECLDQ